MIKIGELNQLMIIHMASPGAFLGHEDSEEEILLPHAYVPKDAHVGSNLEVFVLLDSEDRLVATTQIPKAKVGEFAHLKVVATEKVGAFLDWGMPKDLFLPFAEQTRPLKIGDFVVVYLYLDNSRRISASMKLEKRLEKNADYKIDQEVDLFIAAKTDLGYKAIINNRHVGVLYNNEIFQPLKHGQKLKGYVKAPRPDGKIDLILQLPGLGSKDITAEKILSLLKSQNGFLPLTEKTPPEKIYSLFGVSKKKYKIALGGLYKQRRISIDSEGIRLNKDKNQK